MPLYSVRITGWFEFGSYADTLKDAEENIIELINDLPYVFHIDTVEVEENTAWKQGEDGCSK